MVTFISMAYQVLSAGSSGHLATTFDQIFRLVLRVWNKKNPERFENFFVHISSYVGKNVSKTVKFIIIC